MQVQSLDGVDPQEKRMATHSSILACNIHGHRNLVGYSPWGHKESDTTEHTHASQTLNNGIIKQDNVCLAKFLVKSKHSIKNSTMKMIRIT